MMLPNMFNESFRDSWYLTDEISCSRNPIHHSLFINCGGARTVFEGNEYQMGCNNEQSYFYTESDGWAYSANGVFMGNRTAPFVGTNTNVTVSQMIPHFQALEDAISIYQSKSGVLQRKGFNIMEEAGGVGIGISRDFDNIVVNGSTLDIHLYRAGKGTTAIPQRGVYGPLLSAIEIIPNYDINTGGLSAGAIAGIVIGSCGLVLALLWWRGYIRGDKEDKELRALELQTGYFSLRQIKSATHNFDPTNKIGEGGFGPVYKGVLSDGSEIAVKQLSARSKQGNREFVTEIGMISALQHPNLVKLYGCCIEGKELLLVYEYLINNSLARALFGQEDQKLHLNWSARKKICMGIAKGLAYLQEESRLKIVHRDIKATNVLLDKDLNAKISDFGLAKT
ncbi:unnamed protein product [Lactuca virosa]|uniref:non-specific serine/threonine protein kinase n=1 Tax=Lactuca virosa TaxID=75947 RepID=A0AAU9PK01_9ASTR|nr:unnamed protein product [Lactuca virosa]